MYHSIKFDVLSILDNSVVSTYNTYEDWFLVPTSRPVITIPAPKLNMVDIPGASGKLDLTYVLTKYPLYDNRTGSINFAVLNEHPGYRWIDIYNMIAKSINGKRVRAYLEDDLDYYYEGHWRIGNWTSNNNGSWSDISIEYEVDPYKYYKTDKAFTKYGSEQSKQFIFTSNDIGSMPVVPSITVSNTDSTGVTLSLTNNELGIVDLVKQITDNGTFKFYDLILSMLNNSNTCNLTVFGSGQVTLSFRKGDL